MPGRRCGWGWSARSCPRPISRRKRDKLADILCQNSPGAMAEAKRLIADVTGRPIDAALRSETAGRIARQRASAEGREGVAAFLEKRKPSWRG